MCMLGIKKNSEIFFMEPKGNNLPSKALGGKEGQGMKSHTC